MSATPEEILHQLVGGIQAYADILSDRTLEDVAYVNAERAVFDLITAYGAARAAAERERCAQVVERVTDAYQATRAAQIIRNLD